MAGGEACERDDGIYDDGTYDIYDDGMYDIYDDECVDDGGSCFVKAKIKSSKVVLPDAN